MFEESTIFIKHDYRTSQFYILSRVFQFLLLHRLLFREITYYTRFVVFRYWHFGLLTFHHRQSPFFIAFCSFCLIQFTLSIPNWIYFPPLSPRIINRSSSCSLFIFSTVVSKLRSDNSISSVVRFSSSNFNHRSPIGFFFRVKETLRERFALKRIFSHLTLKKTDLLNIFVAILFGRYRDIKSLYLIERSRVSHIGLVQNDACDKHVCSSKFTARKLARESCNRRTLIIVYRVVSIICSVLKWRRAFYAFYRKTKKKQNKKRERKIFFTRAISLCILSLGDFCLHESVDNNYRYRVRSIAYSEAMRVALLFLFNIPFPLKQYKQASTWIYRY